MSRVSYRSAAVQLGAQECSTVAEHSEAAGRHRMLGALLHVLPDALVGALVTEPEPLVGAPVGAVLSKLKVGAVVAPLLPPPEAKKGGSDIVRARGSHDVKS